MVSPRVRLQVAQAACARELSLRQAGLAVYDGALRPAVSVQAPETGCPAGPGPPGSGETLSAVEVPLSRRLFAASGVACESQSCPPRLAPVRITGVEAEAPEEDQDRDDAAADGQDKNAVWSWDFVHDVTTDGHAFRCLTVKDEHTRWCVAIEVACSFSHERVIAVLTRLIAQYGCPQYIRSDKGPELVMRVRSCNHVIRSRLHSTNSKVEHPLSYCNT